MRLAAVLMAAAFTVMGVSDTHYPDEHAECLCFEGLFLTPTPALVRPLERSVREDGLETGEEASPHRRGGFRLSKLGALREHGLTLVDFFYFSFIHDSRSDEIDPGC